MVVTAPVLPVSGDFDVNNNGQVIVPETGGVVVVPPGNNGPIDSYGAPVGPVINPDGNNRSPAVNPFVRPPFNPRNSFVQYIKLISLRQACRLDSFRQTEVSSFTGILFS